MAITVKTQPEEYMPAYNRVEYSCSSNNSGLPNFRYTFKLYVEGVLTRTFRVPPTPDDEWGIQDFSRVLQKEIIEEIVQAAQTAPFFRGQLTPIVKYRVDLIEYFSSPATDPPTEKEESLITGTDKYVWDASFRYHDWINQINEGSPFNTWLANPTNGASAQFLTSYKTPFVNFDDYGRHWLLTDTPSDLDYVEIIAYDSTGAVIKTCQVNSTLAGSDSLLRLQAVIST